MYEQLIYKIQNVSVDWSIIGSLQEGRPINYLMYFYKVRQVNVGERIKITKKWHLSCPYMLIQKPFTKNLIEIIGKNEWTKESVNILKIHPWRTRKILERFKYIKINK